MVPYKPPMPPIRADELSSWTWDETTESWVSVMTEAGKCAEVRAERDRRMAEVDWVTLRAYRTGKPVPPLYADYMQKLADISKQTGFPWEVEWPKTP